METPHVRCAHYAAEGFFAPFCRRIRFGVADPAWNDLPACGSCFQAWWDTVTYTPPPWPHTNSVLELDADSGSFQWFAAEGYDSVSHAIVKAQKAIAAMAIPKVTVTAVDPLPLCCGHQPSLDRAHVERRIVGFEMTEIPREQWGDWGTGNVVWQNPACSECRADWNSGGYIQGELAMYVKYDITAECSCGARALGFTKGSTGHAYYCNFGKE